MCGTASIAAACARHRPAGAEFWRRPRSAGASRPCSLLQFNGEPAGSRVSAACCAAIPAAGAAAMKTWTARRRRSACSCSPMGWAAATPVKPPLRWRSARCSKSRCGLRPRWPLTGTASLAAPRRSPLGPRAKAPTRRSAGRPRSGRRMPAWARLWSPPGSTTIAWRLPTSATQGSIGCAAARSAGALAITPCSNRVAPVARPSPARGNGAPTATSSRALGIGESAKPRRSSLPRSAWKPAICSCSAPTV